MNLQRKHWAVIIIGILVVVFAILAIWYSFGSHKALAPSSETASSTPIVASSTPVSAGPAHVAEHGSYYDIDLTYPSATPLVSVSADANARAVATMKAEMQNISAEFKKNGNFANLTPEDIKIQGLGADRKYALSSSYDVHTGSRTVSYVFVVYEDTLGAHPNGYYRTFTFDAKTGAELSLDSIFADANYLSALSDIASQQLPAIIAQHEQVSVSEVDTEYMNSGIAPKPESFQSWYINGQQLVIVFPPYQVGPYALGTIELPIPLLGLSTSLKAAYK